MDDELIAYGTEIKALGGGKIGGYLVRFSDAGSPDLVGDYFDNKTAFTIPDTLPLLYNHGMDSTLKKRVIGKAKTKVDDVGVWADAQMDLRDEYEKAIYAMAENGKLGYSSGALSHLVDRELTGKSYHIKTWFIGEASLTPTPAEPRNTVVSLKSLLPSDAALSDTDETNQTNSKMENNIMSDEIKTAVAQAVAEALAQRDNEVKAEAAKAEAIKAAEIAGYNKAVDELKNVKAPAFNTKTELGFSEEKDAVPAFKHWLVTGQVNGGLITPDSSYGNIKAAFNVTTGATGGYLVPDPLYNQIIAKRNLASWARILPTQKFVTDADHLLIPVEATSHTAFVLTAESAAYNENEGTIGQVDLKLYKYTKEVRVTEEFINNQATNFDSWLIGALARAEAVTENTAFTTGTGTGQPLGVVASGGSTAANTTATTDIILPAELTAFAGYLGAGYNVPSECGFLMANVTKWYLRGVTSSAGAFVWAPTPQGNMMQDNLMGYQVAIDDDLEAYTAASAKMIVFGNWNYYGIVEKPGMIIQRNPYLYMANGQVGIFASMFRGGSTLQAEALYHMINHS